MQSFLFDWGVSDHGHYNNLLQPGISAENAYKDVGIGLVNTSGNGVGPLVLTQDFGSQQNEGPQILGVVYNDPTKTGFYAQGEGQGGVTIDAMNLSTGQDYQTQTWSAGGYQIPVAANADYQVTATENGQVISSQQVQVGDVNVETDFVNNPATPRSLLRLARLDPGSRSDSGPGSDHSPTLSSQTSTAQQIRAPPHLSSTPSTQTQTGPASPYDSRPTSTTPAQVVTTHRRTRTRTTRLSLGLAGWGYWIAS